MSFQAEAVEGMEERAVTSGMTAVFDLLTPTQKKALFGAGLWALYERTKDRSYRFKIGPVPVSIKIAKLRPLIVWWVGEPNGVVI